MRAIILLIICLIATNTFASDILFIQKSTTDALELAQKVDKPFFVFYCGRWCPTCKVMEEGTFKDDQVASFAAQNFLAFKANIDTPDGKVWKEKYGVYVVPTIIFFDKNGVQKDLHASTINAANFLDIMQRNAAPANSFASAAPAPISNVYNNTIASAYPTVSPSAPSTQSIVQNNNRVPQTFVTDVLSTVATNESAGLEVKNPQGLKTEAVKLGEVANEKVTIKATKDTPGKVINRSMEVVETVVATNSGQSNSGAQPNSSLPINSNKSTQFVGVANTEAMNAAEGKTWTPKRKKRRVKRRDRKRKERSVKDIAKTNKIEASSKVTEAIGKAEKPVADISKTRTLALNSTHNIDNVKQATRTVSTKRKVKSIVLNPKKEVVPTEIVIRSERSAAPVRQTAPTNSTATNVISVAVNTSTNVVTTNPVTTTGTTSYLQLGHFRNQGNATKLAAKVRMQFFNNIINLKEIFVDGKKIYRVTMTGFQSENQVSEMKTQLREAGFKSYIFK